MTKSKRPAPIHPGAQTIPIAKVRTDGGTQQRAQIQTDVVFEYMDALIDGAELPPILVYFDGADYWLVDGYHRLEAHRRASRQDIAANVVKGSLREAILASVAANASHGLRRSNEDKRKAVAALLLDEEWKTWTDRAIAAACKVSHPFVAGVRAKLTGNVTSRPQENADNPEVRKGQDGRTYNVSGLQARTTEDPPASSTDVSSGSTEASDEQLEQEAVAVAADAATLLLVLEQLDVQVQAGTLKLSPRGTFPLHAECDGLLAALGLRAGYLTNKADLAGKRRWAAARRELRESSAWPVDQHGEFLPQGEPPAKPDASEAKGEISAALLQLLERRGGAGHPDQLSIVRAKLEARLGRRIGEGTWREVIEAGRAAGLWDYRASGGAGDLLVGEIWLTKVEAEPEAAKEPPFYHSNAVFELRKLLTEQADGGVRRPAIGAIRPRLEAKLGRRVPEDKWLSVLEVGPEQGFWQHDAVIDNGEVIRGQIWTTEGKYAPTATETAQRPEAPTLPADLDDPALQGHLADDEDDEDCDDDTDADDDEDLEEEDEDCDDTPTDARLLLEAMEGASVGRKDGWVPVEEARKAFAFHCTGLLDTSGRPPELEPEEVQAHTWAPPGPSRDERLTAALKGLWPCSMLRHLLLDAEEGEDSDALNRRLLLQHWSLEHIAARADQLLAARAEREAYWAEVERQKVEQEARPPRRKRSKGERLEAWQAFMASPRIQAEIEALRNSRVPTELARGAARWVALDPDGLVIGSGETLEEAHAAAVEEQLKLADPEWWISCGDMPEDYEDVAPFLPEIGTYARIQGPEDAVDSIVRRGRVI